MVEGQRLEVFTRREWERAWGAAARVGRVRAAVRVSADAYSLPCQGRSRASPACTCHPRRPYNCRAAEDRALASGKMRAALHCAAWFSFGTAIQFSTGRRVRVAHKVGHARVHVVRWEPLLLLVGRVQPQGLAHQSAADGADARGEARARQHDRATLPLMGAAVVSMNSGARASRAHPKTHTRKKEQGLKRTPKGPRGPTLKLSAGAYTCRPRRDAHTRQSDKRTPRSRSDVRVGHGQAVASRRCRRVADLTSWKTRSDGESLKNSVASFASPPLESAVCAASVGRLFGVMGGRW